QTAAGMPVLRMHEVRKSFDGGRSVAVAGVSLELAEHETFALVGESGSGKSTLARLAVGLVTMDAGTVSLLGHDLAGLKRSALRRLRRHVQFIFQDPYSSLDPRQRIGSALEEPLIVHGAWSAAERRRRVHDMLEKVGLAKEVAERFPH